MSITFQARLSTASKSPWTGKIIAEQDADIIIPGLSYRILIKKDRMYIDAQDFAEAVLYLNDERIVQQWVTIETV